MCSNSQTTYRLLALEGRGLNVRSEDGRVIDSSGDPPKREALRGDAARDKKERTKFGQDESDRLRRLHTAAEEQNLPADRASEVLSSLDPKHTRAAYITKWQRMKKVDGTVDLTFNSPFPGLSVPPQPNAAKLQSDPLQGSDVATALHPSQPQILPETPQQ